MGSGRTFYLSAESMSYVDSQAKTRSLNASQIVERIIIKDKLGNAILTPRVLQAIQLYISHRALTGARLNPQDVIQQAIDQFLGGSLVNIQSNTGYEEAEKSYA